MLRGSSPSGASRCSTSRQVSKYGLRDREQAACVLEPGAGQDTAQQRRRVMAKVRHHEPLDALEVERCDRDAVNVQVHLDSIILRPARDGESAGAPWRCEPRSQECHVRGGVAALVSDTDCVRSNDKQDGR